MVIRGSRRLAAGVGLSAIVVMGLLSSCSAKTTDPAPTTTEESMIQGGPNSFAPTMPPMSPTMGANSNNQVHGADSGRH